MKFKKTTKTERNMRAYIPPPTAVGYLYGLNKKMK